MIEGAQIHDFDWRYLYVNDALVNLSTYTREELIGFTLMEKYPALNKPKCSKPLNRCMIDRVGAKFETEFVFPNGTKKDFELSIEPIPKEYLFSQLTIPRRKGQKKNCKKPIVCMLF
jgi:PAS domain-containing protein